MTGHDVFGAGVLGLSAALALLRDGHAVTVVEPDQPGAGASGKAAGIISVVCHEPDDVGLVRATRSWLRDQGLFHRTGSLTIVAPEHEVRLDRIVQDLQGHGQSAQVLDAQQVGDRWGGLWMADDERALWVPDDGVTEPGDLVATLQALVEREGGVVQRHPSGHETRVAAAGAWTPRLLQEWGVKLPLAAFRTQAAHIEGAAFPVAVHDAVHGFYFRPDGPGLLVGNGTQLVPHDPDAYNERGDKEFEHSIAERLHRRLPGSGAAVIRNSWAGLCVGTPDARPVCGPVGKGRAVLSGDNGHGVMRSIALGRRLARSLQGHIHPATNPLRFAEPDAPWQMREGFGW